MISIAPLQRITMDPSALVGVLKEMEVKFKRACTQVVLLNNQLDEWKIRCERAVKAKNQAFGYNLRLKMSVAESVRLMFYEYASRKADEITMLKCQLYGPDYHEEEEDYDTASEDDDEDEDYDNEEENHGEEQEDN